MMQAADRARHARRTSGKSRCDRIGIAVGIQEHIAACARRRHLAIVDRDGAFFPGEVDEHEPAAAEISGARQRDRQCQTDRDCRIDGIATVRQNLGADSRCNPFLGNDHAVGISDRMGPRWIAQYRRRIGTGRKPAAQHQDDHCGAENQSLHHSSVVGHSIR